MNKPKDVAKIGVVEEPMAETIDPLLLVELDRSSAFASIASDVAQVVGTKNRKYGDSFAECATFMRMMYPNGIQPDQYDGMLYLARDFDKSKRIATNQEDDDEDPIMDKCGYALLMLEIKRRQTAKY